MKKAIIAVLAAALILSLAGCGLFSDNSIVKLGDSYTHKDPSGVTYDQRVVLKGDDFGQSLADSVNSAAYPDTMMYGDDGSITGIYDYDPETGFAYGWTDLLTGEYTAFAEGDEVDLGKPDASMLVTIPGDVTVYFVVYGNKGEALSAYMYLFLSDASAKSVVEECMQSAFGMALTEESDTVLTFVQDAGYISDQFRAMEEYGMTFDSKDANAYAEILMQYYGVRSYGGVNPYKPYSGHTDPADLDFDERVVLTGSGDTHVDEEYAADITAVTDFVYGKDGVVIAQYTYYECPSKEAADELLAAGTYFFNPERFSDTIILDSVTGSDMVDLVTAYKGYNVLKDDSLDAYVKMLEGTYFSVVCE